jgi:hypothetical protein
VPNEEAIIDSDRKVVAALLEAGDPLRVAREVKHWVYFSSRVGAEMFAEWLAAEGLRDIDIAEEDTRDDLVWRVTYTHEIRPTLEAVTAHTVPAAHEAERLGGRYDGWETSVEAE